MKKNNASELAKDAVISSKGGSVVVSKIPKSDIPVVREQLKKYDLITPATMIYKSKGVFKDDPENVYNAFRMFQNQVHLQPIILKERIKLNCSLILVRS